MKASLKVVAVLVVIIGVAVWYLASNIDGIVKRIIEDVGTQTLATEVTLGSAEINLGSESSAALNDLTIANPKGYATSDAFTLGSISVAISTASLSTDVVVLPTIVVTEAHLTYEQQGNSSNLQALLDNMDAGSNSAADSASDESGEDILLAIAELRLAGMGVTVVSDQLDKPFDFVLKDIVVRDIGKPDAGVTPEAAAERIIDPVIKAALKEAKQKAKDVIEARVREDLDKKKDEAKKDAKDSLLNKLRGD